MKTSVHYFFTAWILLIGVFIIDRILAEIHLISLMLALALIILIACTGLYIRIGEK